MYLRVGTTQAGEGLQMRKTPVKVSKYLLIGNPQSLLQDPTPEVLSEARKIFSILGYVGEGPFPNHENTWIPRKDKHIGIMENRMETIGIIGVI